MRKRAVSFIVSGLLLAILYWLIDLSALAAAVRGSDPAWLAAGLLMVIPLTLATAWRFGALVMEARVTSGEAVRLVLAASTLNLFLPSKLGDLAKAYVLSAKHRMNGELALSVVVFEKALDMASLLICGAAASLYLGLSRPAMFLAALPILGLLALCLLLIVPLPLFPAIVRAVAKRLPAKIGASAGRFAESSAEMAAWFWSRPRRAAGIALLSILLWAAHLFQFWLFTGAVGAVVPVADTMAFATLSILVGLLPFTFAGIGSRDIAIVLFFAPYMNAGAAALLGLLATLRYVLPALVGIPFVGDLAAAAASRRKAQSPASAKP